MMAGPRTGGGRPGRFRRLPRRGWIAISGTAAAASLGLALLVFTAVFISVAIPRANLGQRTRALQRVLAAAPATSTAVLGDLSYTTFDVNFNEHPFAADQLAATRAELAAWLAEDCRWGWHRPGSVWPPAMPRSLVLRRRRQPRSRRRWRSSTVTGSTVTAT